MAPDDFIHTPLQRGHVQRGKDSQSRMEIVEGALGRQLVEDPQAPLGIGSAKNIGLAPASLPFSNRCLNVYRRAHFAIIHKGNILKGEIKADQNIVARPL